MTVWRQAQSSNGQGKPHNLRRYSRSTRSGHPDSSATWRLLFSDKCLYFLFKDILLDCSKQSSDSNSAHTYAEALSLRYVNGPGLYELSAAPARATLRKILESSLRLLIQDLVISNAAKYGTWQDIRLLDTPATPFGFSGIVSQETSRTSMAPQVSLGLSPSYPTLVAAALFKALYYLYSTEDVESFNVPWTTSYAASLRPECPARNEISIHAHPHIRATNDLLMQTQLPLKHAVYTSAQMSFSIHKSFPGNTFFSIPLNPVAGSCVSKSTTFFTIDLDAIVDILRLGLSKV